MKENKLTILYQLDCGFCNWYRDFVSARVQKGELRFIDIAGEEGLGWISKLNLPIDPSDPSTFVVIDESETPHYRWRACMIVGLQLRTPWRQLSRIGQFVPGHFGDFVYNFISHRRGLAGRLVGQSNTCDID